MAKRTPRSTAGNRQPAITNAATFQNPVETMTAEATDMGGPNLRSESMASEPSEEDIRMRAYRRYLERGGGDGQDFDDWLEAERELKRQR
jgi:hypothetical protein